MNIKDLPIALIVAFWAATNALVSGYNAINGKRDWILTASHEGKPVSLEHRRLAFVNDWLPLKFGLARFRLSGIWDCHPVDPQVHGDRGRRRKRAATLHYRLDRSVLGVSRVLGPWFQRHAFHSGYVEQSSSGADSSCRRAPASARPAGLDQARTPRGKAFSTARGPGHFQPGSPIGQGRRPSRPAHGGLTGAEARSAPGSRQGVADRSRHHAQGAADSPPADRAPTRA